MTIICRYTCRTSATILVAALALNATALLAQRTAVDSATAIMNDAFAALGRRDYDAFTRAMHPEALAEFSAMMLPALTQAAETGDTTGSGDILRYFPGITTLADLAKLSPEALFSGIVRAGMAGMDTVEMTQPHVIGGVMEGDSLVHLVYRMSVATGEGPLTSVSVASLKRAPAGWRMMLTGGLGGLDQLFGGGSSEPDEE